MSDLQITLSPARELRAGAISERPGSTTREMAMINFTSGLEPAARCEMTAREMDERGIEDETPVYQSGHRHLFSPARELRAGLRWLERHGRARSAGDGYGILRHPDVPPIDAQGWVVTMGLATTVWLRSDGKLFTGWAPDDRGDAAEGTDLYRVLLAIGRRVLERREINRQSREYGWSELPEHTLDDMATLVVRTEAPVWRHWAA